MDTIPSLLAIETATTACSVAFLDETGRLYERFEIIPQQHTQRIFPMIQEVLAEARRSLSSVGAIAVGRGPGSFTGVRIAVSIAQGLGYGLNKPVYPVSTLAAMAYGVIKGVRPLLEKGPDPFIDNPFIVTPILDARMQEYYIATYCVTAHDIKIIEKEQIISVNDLPAWEGKLETLPRAKEVALLARMNYLRGDPGLSAQDVLPVYLRDKVTLTRGGG